jgi:membrane protease YdiL (CAAX protease family)
MLGLKKSGMIAYLLLLSLLSAAFVAAARFAGEYGAYLAQGYMLLPAIAALLTRAFWDPRRFTDANLRPGPWKAFVKFWLFGLAISALVFGIYTLLGVGHWDLSGASFLESLEAQFALAGQDLEGATPAGLTPQVMLWLFFAGGLTTFNLLPGLITGFGEEFGWRGLMFPRLYALRPWMAFGFGGLIWFAWHLPLTLIAPLQAEAQPALILGLLLALGSLCTHTYLAYVYVKSRSVWVTALAHITLNNAQASFSYLFVVEDRLLANLGLVLAMLIVVAGLATRGELKVFRQYFGQEPFLQTRLRET